MLNEKLQELFQGIEAVSDLKGVKFAYSMARNKESLKRELETLQQAIKPSDKFTEYDKKRVELCEKHADKDDKGKAKMAIDKVTKRQEYVIPDMPKFEKELAKTRKEYAKVIEERDVQLKEFTELLKKESTFEPFKVNYEDIPQEITPSAMSQIIELVEEPK